METPTPSQSPESPSPSSTGASWRSRWVQRLSWLISALSRTLEIEAAYKQRMKELDRDNERLDRMILQTKKENDRLAVLESKIDLQIRHKLASTPEPRSALADFLSFLEEYSE